ncbi:mitochondrial carrier homolog 1 isoform X1 [Pezoporus flaviventris]|uniref:mitochondrial carrier homolog 1 isoform X1 n=1 Tax=Pezoporus flaviventris TaxID=889875 RepID=UPI002AAF36D3|nr:mitochondrial carrier homolog 1 isoform X1 [Pezoporus flaviventris]
MAAVASPLPPAAPAPPGGAAGPPEGSEALLVALGAGLAAASHPLLYVKLLVQVGHEPLPPTIGRNVLGRKVLYLPGFFTYARHIVEVDGKRGLFRGLTPRLISSTLSTITRGSVKKACPLEDMEHVSNKDDVKTSLRKVVKETSHEMMMQCMSRVVSHPLHVISMRCMVQFIGREVKYSGVFSAIGRILKEEGILGFFVGLVPHILGDVIFLWCCNLLAHFINTYAVDDNFSQASVIRSYTKFVIGIAVSMLTYPFLLVGDLMAVNNCGLLIILDQRIQPRAAQKLKWSETGSCGGVAQSEVDWRQEGSKGLCWGAARGKAKLHTAMGADRGTTKLAFSVPLLQDMFCIHACGKETGSKVLVWCFPSICRLLKV